MPTKQSEQPKRGHRYNNWDAVQYKAVQLQRSHLVGQEHKAKTQIVLWQYTGIFYLY